MDNNSSELEPEKYLHSKKDHPNYLKQELQLEPKIYLPSKDDPNYLTQELQYVLNHDLPERDRKKLSQCSSEQLKYIFDHDLFERGGKKRNSHNNGNKVTEQLCLNKILQGWKKAFDRKGTLILPKETEKYAIKALKEFGVDALRCPVQEERFVRENYANRTYLIEEMLLKGESVSFPKQLPEIIDQLGAAVCMVLRYWRNQVLKGDHKTRGNARKRLQEVGKALIPDTRGKRKITTDTREIRFFYWKEMFRLYHIQHWLEQIFKTGSEVERIGKNFNMPPDQIRKIFLKHLKDLDDYIPELRDVSIKEIARKVTAKHFNLRMHTVSNILAS